MIRNGYSHIWCLRPSRRRLAAPAAIDGRAGRITAPKKLTLCGTVHWMFDASLAVGFTPQSRAALTISLRGLISLSDELDVLVSRQVNDPDSVWSLVNKSRRAPSTRSGQVWRRRARRIGRIRILRQAQDRLSWPGIGSSVSSSRAASFVILNPSTGSGQAHFRIRGPVAFKLGMQPRSLRCSTLIPKRVRDDGEKKLDPGSSPG
jgi:hypothetical protein